MYTRLLAVTLLCASSCSNPRPEAEELRAAVEASKATTNRLNAAQREALMALDAAETLPLGDQPCPVEVQLGSQKYPSERLASVRREILRKGSVESHGNTVRFESARFEKANLALSALGWAVDDDDDGRGKTLVAEAKDMGRKDWWDHDAIYVRHQLDHPKMEGKDTFVPGRSEGRLYVYNYTQQRVVCAADVVAFNSDTVSCTVTMGELSSGCLVELYLDLTFHAWSNGIPLLRQIPAQVPAPE